MLYYYGADDELMTSKEDTDKVDHVIDSITIHSNRIGETASMATSQGSTIILSHITEHHYNIIIILLSWYLMKCRGTYVPL